MRRRTFIKSSLSAAGLLAFRAHLRAAFPLSPTLAKFVQPLPGIPVAVKDSTVTAHDYYEISQGQYQQQVHPGLPPTTFWGYADVTQGRTASHSYLGPVIVAARNRMVKVKFHNNLPTSGFHPLPVDYTAFDAENGAVPYRAVPHLHGGFIPWDSDGGPRSWWLPGGDPMTNPGVLRGSLFRSNVFTYPNAQRAALLWYHDHAQGLTRLNAYAGLAAPYILTDSDEQALQASGAIPSRLLPLVIQDKSFKADGSLFYPDAYDSTLFELGPGGLPLPPNSLVPEFWADTMCVNGAAYPYVQVSACRYRLRILNGSQARFLRLRLLAAEAGANPTEAAVPNVVGPAFTQIGTEGGFLPTPVTLNHTTRTLLLAPAERADIIVDFSGVPNSKWILYNDAGAPFPSGDPIFDYATPGTSPDTRTIVRFDVGSAPATPQLGDSFAGRIILPAIQKLNGLYARTRDLILGEDMDEFGRLRQLIGTVGLGPLSFHAPCTENPRKGDTEIWRFFNLSGDTHPIHFHLVNVQILSRQPLATDALGNVLTGADGYPLFAGPARGPEPNEFGWKETVRMNPAECTRVIMKFELPPGAVADTVDPGKHHYVYHCHILEHEEHDMMRPLVVTE